MPYTYPTLVSSSRAAALWGVSTATVRRWAKEGKIKSIRTPGGAYRYDVTAWMSTEPAAEAKVKSAKVKPAKVANEKPVAQPLPKEMIASVIEQIKAKAAEMSKAQKLDPDALRSQIERIAGA